MTDRRMPVILGGDPAALLLADNAQTLEGVGVPPARDRLAKLRDPAVPVFV